MNKIYQKWLYGYNPLNAEPYQVVPEKRREMPSSFYKYYALTDNSIDALSNQYVYASHPYQLNDPFDCDLRMIQFKTPQSAAGLFGKNLDLADTCKKMFRTEKEYMSFCNQSFWTILYRKLGILSLTTTNIDMRMWALYAQNSGFCLEFDTTLFPFIKNGPFPIHYCRNIKPVIIDDNIDMHIPMLIQTNVKHKHWEYEDEWRLLIQPPRGVDLQTKGNKFVENLYDKYTTVHNRKFHYPIEALKSVVLGFHFFRDVISSDRYVKKRNGFLLRYEKECNQTKVLDILSLKMRHSKVKIYLLCKDINKPLEKFITIPIKISRYQQYTYHLTEEE